MQLLQEEVDGHPGLRAFVVYIGGDSKEIGQVAASHHIERIGVMQVPVDDAALQGYQLRAVDSLRNVVFVYKKKKVMKKFVNLKLDAAGAKSLRAALERVM